MKKKRYKCRKYFPHNIREIQQSPDHFFCSLPYDELMEWKINGYELPDSVFCLMRIRNKDTQLIEERYYNTTHYAKRRLAKCIQDGSEVTMVSNEGCYHIDSRDVFLDFNND